MSGVHPDADVVAELKLFSTEQGGRKGPTPQDQLRCIFHYEGEGFDCVLLLREVGSLAPGQAATVPIAFLFPEYIRDRLRTGSEFRLWEGRFIAEGRVCEILA